MSLPKSPRLLGALFLGLSAWAATAQAPTPPPAPSGTPPGAEEPGPAPSPNKRQAAPPAETPAGHELLGMSVFSSDGSKIGDVSAVDTDRNGKVTALRVRSGGFLGFGARVVAIPEGQFERSGPDVRLAFTAEEVQRLPQIRDGR